MLTPYDRKQQAAERAAAQARRELQGVELGVYTIQPSCDWDAAFGRILPTTPDVPGGDPS